MYVTRHAWTRLVGRLGPEQGEEAALTLERQPGEQGTVAYLLADLPAGIHVRDGSNGDILVGIAVEGAVETVYFRRQKQDMSARFFGARKVVDMREKP